MKSAFGRKLSDLFGLCLTFCVWANSFVTNAEARAIDPEPKARPSYVVIVPGSLVYADHSPSDVLRDRLECARELWQAGKVTRILVSGDHGSPRYDEVNAMHDWLVRAGIPDQAIFLDHAGFRTFDTMQRAARVFGVKDALVCSQAFHLPRALFLAREAGIDARGVVADRRKYRHEVSFFVRERVAVTVAVAESVLGHGPRYLGSTVDLSGPAAVTHDRSR